MINFDSLTLRAFIDENFDFFTGAFVRKIRQFTRRDILLNLYKEGIGKKLYINIHPSYFHLCFLESESLDSYGLKVPNDALMFCMLLRKYLMNSRIIHVVQPQGERIFEIHFDYRDPLGQKSVLCLSAELMGRHSNIILYNRDSGIIIGCAHNVGEDKSRFRELSGTLPYLYPPRRNKTVLSDFEAFSQGFYPEDDVTSVAFRLSSDFSDITVPIVVNACRSLNIHKFSKVDIKALFEKLHNIVSLKNIYPSVSEDFSQFSISGDLQGQSFVSVNSMIETYFTHHRLSLLIESARTKLLTFIDTEIKKLSKQHLLLSEKLLLLSKAHNYKLKADILMMNPSAALLPRTVLLNPYDNTFLEIDTDVSLSVVENANRYYRLYKKAKSAADYAGTRIQELQLLLRNAEEQKFYIECASSLFEIEQISAELGLVKNVIKRNQKLPELTSFVIDGFKVFIGKNSIQNDYLLSKISSPDDIWFHPLNIPGAHLILKKNSLKEVISQDTLRKCALLTKEYSKAKNDSKTPIIYTLRKYVKKANNKIAFVTYKNETEIFC